MILTLYDFLRIGHIKRWHNVNTIRQQTVAEHCFLVAVIALDLLFHLKWGGEHPKAWVGSTLVAALFHDAPEAAAGDTPTPAKRLLREITNDPKLFDKLDDRLMPQLPYLGGKVPPFIERIVEMADAIEAYHWITDNGAGTHAKIVAGYVRRKMEDLVEKHHVHFPDEGWYEAVNKVLMAMNVPFVHRESRLSPP